MRKNKAVDSQIAQQNVPSESIAESQMLALDKATKFDVSIETVQGTPLITFQGIPAKIKAQAIHKASQMLVFTAGRS